MDTLLKKCNDGLLSIFMQAAKKASAEGKKTIEPTHLLFGLTHQPAAKTRRSLTPAKTSSPKKLQFVSLSLSKLSSEILSDAATLAQQYRHGSIGPEHVFISLLHSEKPAIQKMLKDYKVDRQSLKNQLLAIVNHSTKMLDLIEMLDHTHEHEPHHEHKQSRQKHQSALEFFAVQLTDPAVAVTIDPVIGRTTEIDRLIRILARRTKNNPVLVGHPGVGKTAIVEGLAKRIAEGAVPAYLADKHIYALDLPALVAGSAMRGELEIRLKALIEEVQHDPQAILFIDEIHNLVGAGSFNGSLDGANILKPALARGELRCIGATTFDEYKRNIEDDPALDRRFQSIVIDQPSEDETEKILRGLLPRYEEFHGVTILPDALHMAVELSGRYLHEKFFPDKAIDVVDEAAAKVKIDGGESSVITKEIIANIVSSMSGIPFLGSAESESDRVAHLEETLSGSIVGQDHVKKSIARSVRRALSGLREKGRPQSSFLFLGPSGVGKTEMARVLAQELFGKDGFIRLDMSEFSESFTLARLIGSPSGYIGYKEGGRLTEAVRRHPHSLILFDEAEKAHPRVLNVLLQILDEGVLTDAAGKQVDFSNTIVVLTSNAGSHHWTGASPIGFGSPEQNGKEKTGRVLKELKQHFSSELLNRIDNTLSFDPLTQEQMADIASLHLAKLQKKITSIRVALSWDPQIPQKLAARLTDSAHGARDIRRIIETEIEDIIAQTLLSRTADQSSTLKIKHSKGLFSCRTIS